MRDHIRARSCDGQGKSVRLKNNKKKNEEEEEKTNVSPLAKLLFF